MASPTLTITIEPSENNIVHYLKCAPAIAGGSETGDVNLFLTITNTGTGDIHLDKIEISVLGSATGAEAFTADLTLAAGDAANWTLPKDYVFAIPANPSLKLRFFADGFSQAAFIIRSLVPHSSPTTEGSYQFWGAIRDLRPGEFWQLHGTSHSQSVPQLYAYDVGVAVDDPTNPQGFNMLLPGTNVSKNENFRIWGKPIYAIADGTVTDFRYYFPTNAVPLVVAPEIEKFWARVSEGGLGKDGNGNFFTILTTGGRETVLYAHMQLNSLNPKFLVKGAAVKKGDFLGLAGNSGASGNPHLHIHVNRGNTGTQSWVDDPLPMPLRNARAVAWSSLGITASSAPWVKLNGRGIPTTDCAVWPSDSKVVDLKNVTIKHFSISDGGQVWAVKSDGKVLTTSDHLPTFGVFFDVDPTGSAKEVAVRGEKPYLIGIDDRIWEGLSNGWFPVSGSPNCKRITVDATSGKLWVIDHDNRILSYNPSTGNWVKHPQDGQAKDICVLKGVPHVIGTDDRIWKSVGQNGWAQLPGEQKGKSIAADEQRDTLWIVGMNDKIWSYNGDGTWKENPAEGLVKDIVVFRGIPYTIRFGDSLWQSIGKFGWVKLNLVEPR